MTVDTQAVSTMPTTRRSFEGRTHDFGASISTGRRPCSAFPSQNRPQPVYTTGSPAASATGKPRGGRPSAKTGPYLTPHRNALLFRIRVPADVQNCPVPQRKPPCSAVSADFASKTLESLSDEDTLSSDSCERTISNTIVKSNRGLRYLSEYIQNADIISS